MVGLPAPAGLWVVSEDTPLILILAYRFELGPVDLTQALGHWALRENRPSFPVLSYSLRNVRLVVGIILALSVRQRSQVTAIWALSFRAFSWVGRCGLAVHPDYQRAVCTSKSLCNIADTNLVVGRRAQVEIGRTAFMRPVPAREIHFIRLNEPTLFMPIVIVSVRGTICESQSRDEAEFIYTVQEIPQ